MRNLGSVTGNNEKTFFFFSAEARDAVDKDAASRSVTSTELLGAEPHLSEMH